MTDQEIGAPLCNPDPGACEDLGFNGTLRCGAPPTDYCEVGNAGGVDDLECTCDGEVAAGSGGSEEWAGLSGAELAEVCLEQLQICDE